MTFNPNTKSLHSFLLLVFQLNDQLPSLRTLFIVFNNDSFLTKYICSNISILVLEWFYLLSSQKWADHHDKFRRHNDFLQVITYMIGKKYVRIWQWQVGGKFTDILDIRRSIRSIFLTIVACIISISWKKFLISDVSV